MSVLELTPDMIITPGKRVREREARSILARSAYNEAQARNRKRAMEMIPLLRIDGERV